MSTPITAQPVHLTTTEFRNRLLFWAITLMIVGFILAGVFWPHIVARTDIGGSYMNARFVTTHHETGSWPLVAIGAFSAVTGVLLLVAALMSGPQRDQQAQ